VPVVSGTTLSGLQGVSFVPFGVQLSFTPFITDKDRIRLTVNATVSVRDVATGTSIGANAGGAGSFVPGLNTRSITTTVEMREGQTLAIGGLLQTNLAGDTTRVPFFGDIPFGGQFFRDDHTSAAEQELVLLVTPELVHPMEPNEIPPLPGSDYFEPSDKNFYLKGKLENSRSYDYRSPVMHDIERMRAYRNCEIIYMLGPTGYTDGH
jgi:pilus assembly protein CpaC